MESVATRDGTLLLDLAKICVRELNQLMHHELPTCGAQRVEIVHPDGRHNLAVGLDWPVQVDIRGHAVCV